MNKTIDILMEEENNYQRQETSSMERIAEKLVEMRKNNRPKTYGKSRRTKFNAIVDEHKEHLFHYINAYCKDDELARDLLQESLIHAHYHYANGLYQEQGKAWQWLQSIAKNKLRSYYRVEANRRLALCLNYEIICENMGWDAVDMSDMDDLLPDERKEKILRSFSSLLATNFGLLQLSPFERRMICLRCKNDWSFTQLAEFLGENVSTLMSRFYRATQKIQEQLLELERTGFFDYEISEEKMRAIIQQRRLRMKKRRMMLRMRQQCDNAAKIQEEGRPVRYRRRKISGDSH